MSDKVYGVVVGGTFHSGRMTRKLRRVTANGIYAMDMGADDFESTLLPADMSEASSYFRKASRLEVIRGVSFKDGFIPENPVAYPEVPIRVIDPTYDEFEEVEVVLVKPAGHYFLRTVETANAYPLMELKDRIGSKDKAKFSDIKGVTPAMRVAYALHLIELNKKEELEPQVAVRRMMEETGAKVAKVEANNRGFVVSWSFDKYNFVTIFDKQLKVVNAGYCVRNQDKLLSPRSIVNVLKDGIAQHGNDGMIHATLAYDGDDFEEDPDDE